MIVDGLGGAESLDVMLADYQARRDEALEPEWQFTLGALQVKPPAEQDVARARLLASRPDLCDLEVRVQLRMAASEEFELAVASAMAEMVVPASTAHA